MEKMTIEQIIVTTVIGLAIIALYSRRASAPVVFFTAAVILTAAGILSPTEAIAGFANEAIAVMLMLILLSGIIRKTGVLEWLFYKKIPLSMKYHGFLAQMIPFTAGTSAFINNTPIVAMLIPFVRDWGRKHGVPVSKLLMPLSWAAILGGMVTLIGTSTNLIVNGMVVGSGGDSLQILDFAPVGLMILATGMAYIFLIGYKLLPSRKDPAESVAIHPREYMANVIIEPDSPLAGKTIEQAHLRNLKGLFLAEIIRNGNTIAPVKPGDILFAGDKLVLVGDTGGIAELIGKFKGLKPTGGFELPKEEKVKVIETVVSTRSSLIGTTVKQTGFRGKFDAAILAVHRKGERLKGKIGSIKLQPGDLLILVAGSEFGERTSESDDLHVISLIKELHNINFRKSIFVVSSSLLCILLSIFSIVPLFISLTTLLALFMIFGITSLSELKQSLNMNLLITAAFAFAVGSAVANTELGSLLSGTVVSAFSPLGTIGLLAAIYIVTNILAEFITTTAAACIVFPFAVSVAALQTGIPATPFYLAVAYGAAANFITPLGYQTNLMIYGPGGYRFTDYLKAGLPLKVICAAVAICGLGLVYGLF